MKDYPSQWVAGGFTCRRIPARASDYIDGRLPLGAQVRVGLHLASCLHCRNYLTQLALVRDTLEQFPPIAIRPFDRLRLRRQFARVHPQHPFHCDHV